MSDPVPDVGILCTGPAFIGRVTAGSGAAKSLTAAEALSLIALALAAAPTEDPEIVGAVFVDNGVVSVSGGFLNGWLLFNKPDHSQYLALFNEDF